MNGKVTDASMFSGMSDTHIAHAVRMAEQHYRSIGRDPLHCDVALCVLRDCDAPAKPEAVRLRDELRERAGLESAAREVVTLIRSIPESELLALDADKHPPSSLSEAANTLQAALAATGKKTAPVWTAEMLERTEREGAELHAAVFGRKEERDAATGKQQVGEAQEPVGFVSQHTLDCLPIEFTGRIDFKAYPGSARTIPVYLAPPAQAVDLGQFHNAVAFAIACLNSADDQPEYGQLESLLALIDGQA